MKVFRKVLSALVAAVTLAAPLSPAVSADALDGETSRTFRTLTYGAQYAGYVLGSSSEYGVQEFSAVTFDSRHGDLRFDALPAPAQPHGQTDGPGTLRDTVTDFARENGRRVIAAVSVGTAGEETPRGYTVYGAEMISSGVPGANAPGGATHSPGAGVPGGATHSFGVAADKTALIGEISVSAELRNRRTGETATARALNCPLTEGAIAVYTDRSGAHIPDDAYQVAVDFDYDYSLTPGAPLEGTVGEVICPGGPRAAMTAGRVIIAACGECAEELAGFMAGDPVTLTADISDAFGNTALWRTVGSALGGEMLLHRGEKINSDDRSRHSASVVGLRPDGSVVMLASYGRQKGYSLGFTMSELADICASLGMTDALLLGTDDSGVMLCESESGVLAPTGKARMNGTADGVAAVISVVGEGGTADVAEVAEYEDHTFRVRAAKDAGYSVRLTDGSELFRRIVGMTVPDTSPQLADTDAAEPIALFAAAADTEASICSLYKQIEFDSTGEWLTLVINESDLEAWYGKIFVAPAV